MRLPSSSGTRHREMDSNRIRYNPLTFHFTGPPAINIIQRHDGPPRPPPSEVRIEVHPNGQHSTHLHYAAKPLYFQ